MRSALALRSSALVNAQVICISTIFFPLATVSAQCFVRIQALRHLQCVYICVYTCSMLTPQHNHVLYL